MRHTGRFLLFTLTVLVLALVAGPAQASTIGWVTGLVGKGSVERPGVGQVAAAVGLGIETGDTLVTGPGGRMKVLLVDDTILALGSDSRVDLAAFDFNPHKKVRRSLFGLIKGKVRVLVGKLFAIETNVKIRTPTAVAGVTGTTLVVEYDPVRQATHVLTLHGLVGVSSTDAGRPGVFHLAAREITTVYAGRNPDPARTATQEEIQAYLEATFVADQPELSRMPGRTQNIIDNPTAGVDKNTLPSSYSRTLAAQTEGEGGAEFDAYIVPDNAGHLSDTDLPLPGDQNDGIGGLTGDGTGAKEDDARVKVTVEFQDDSDEEDKD